MMGALTAIVLFFWWLLGMWLCAAIVGFIVMLPFIIAASRQEMLMDHEEAALDAALKLRRMAHVGRG